MAAPGDRPTDLAEGFAIGGAILCLAHCLLLPLLLAWLPSVSRAIDPGIDLHLWAVCIAGPVSGWLLLGAMRRRRAGVLAAGAGGLALLVLALVLPVDAAQETQISVAGSLMLAGAHVANWLRRHRGHGHYG